MKGTDKPPDKYLWALSRTYIKAFLIIKYQTRPEWPAEGCSSSTGIR